MSFWVYWLVVSLSTFYRLLIMNNVSYMREIVTQVLVVLSNKGYALSHMPTHAICWVTVVFAGRVLQGRHVQWGHGAQ